MNSRECSRYSTSYAAGSNIASHIKNNRLITPYNLYYMLTIIIQVNVLGSVYPTRAVLAGMKKKKAGRIVFVASQVAQVHCGL